MTNLPNPADWGLPDCALEPLPAGHLSAGFRTRGLGNERVFKTTTRSQVQLAWLADCASVLKASSIAVALPMAGLDGRFVQNGWISEPFVPGRSLENAEWTRVRTTLRRMQKTAFGKDQRPGFLNARGFLKADASGDIDFSKMPEAVVRKCRTAFAAIPSAPLTLVHGSLTPSNLAVTPWGQFVLYDWDDARVDHPLFDLVAIGALDNPIPKRAALAYEVATCWQSEPERARVLAERL